MLPANHPVDARFINAYVVHVCPLKRTQNAHPVSCLEILRAPPIEIQRQIVELVDNVPVPVKGAFIDALVNDRVDDAAFLLTHADLIDRVDKIINRSRTILDIEPEQHDSFES